MCQIYKDFRQQKKTTDQICRHNNENDLILLSELALIVPKIVRLHIRSNTTERIAFFLQCL